MAERSVAVITKYILKHGRTEKQVIYPNPNHLEPQIKIKKCQQNFNLLLFYIGLFF